MPEGRIQDRVAIVTGGASGIGKATVEVFAQEGAKVIIGDLADSKGEEVARSVGGTFVDTKQNCEGSEYRTARPLRHL